MINEVIKNKLKELPHLPGIYKMLDNKGNIIYVGKSKCLNKRVKSYFAATPTWEKVKKMVGLIQDIDYVVTDTHLEARLLECELIKSIKPVFNSQMKNDNRYVYLSVGNNHKQAPLTVTAYPAENSFGPFRSKHTLIDAVSYFNNLYPLTKDEGSYQFNYHILPCIMDKDNFLKTREALLEILGSSINLEVMIRLNEEKMMTAASELKFETASFYRDVISGLKYMKHGIDGYSSLLNRKIILKIPSEKGVKLFLVSEGNIIHKKLYKTMCRKNLDAFIRKGNETLIKDNLPLFPTKGLIVNTYDKEFMTEKMSIDFRDILYSEITSLSEDKLLFL
jgi:excinuclease ABC subunit C